MSAIHTSTFVVEVHASWSIRFIMASPIKQNEHVKIGSLLKLAKDTRTRQISPPRTSDPKRNSDPGDASRDLRSEAEALPSDGRCLQLLHGPHFVELCQPILLLCHATCPMSLIPFNSFWYIFPSTWFRNPFGCNPRLRFTVGPDKTALPFPSFCLNRSFKQLINWMIWNSNYCGYLIPSIEMYWIVIK